MVSQNPDLPEIPLSSVGEYGYFLELHNAAIAEQIIVIPKYYKINLKCSVRKIGCMVKNTDKSRLYIGKGSLTKFLVSGRDITRNVEFSGA